MPFNSFNTKKNQAFDQRAAASDNAQLANLGGRIFNVGGKGNPTAEAQSTNWTPIVLAVVVVVLIVALFRRN